MYIRVCAEESRMRRYFLLGLIEIQVDVVYLGKPPTDVASMCVCMSGISPLTQHFGYACFTHVKSVTVH